LARRTGIQIVSASSLFWRRLDVHGLERLTLSNTPDGITATSTIICLEAGGVRIEHCWRIDSNWHAQSVDVERWGAQGHSVLRLERAGSAWQVNGTHRSDLEGADEPDLSVTPFCNTFPILKTPDGVGESFSLDTAFIDAATMTVSRSRQRYDRLGFGRLRYADLGLLHGFEAELVVDDDGFVLQYGSLFERVAPLN
jgi:uncharacterized protein